MEGDTTTRLNETFKIYENTFGDDAVNSLEKPIKDFRSII